ncbi:MAG: hypothetical protein AAGG56_06145 [Pseudomonadota bacterium]
MTTRPDVFAVTSAALLGSPALAQVARPGVTGRPTATLRAKGARGGGDVALGGGIVSRHREDGGLVRDATRERRNKISSTRFADHRIWAGSVVLANRPISGL